MSSLDLGDSARADVADLLDLQLSPLGLAAIEALSPRAGQAILDIGCGAGETVLQLAQRVGPAGHVIGIDIAPRVLAVARTRAAYVAQVQLIEGDAATLALPDAIADGVYSRFGVMAFDDPAAAFANLHRMTRRGGCLSFVCWRSLAENELDWLPLQAAALDTPIDKTPFRFERRDYVLDLLRSTGFHTIEVEPFDAAVTSGDVDAMTTVLTKVGPLGKILREKPALFSVAEPKVREALSVRERDGVVRLQAATWIVTARA